MRGSVDRCAITEVKQRLQGTVVRWVTKIFYLELFCALAPAALTVVST
jgi:hypothetical protein